MTSRSGYRVAIVFVVVAMSACNRGPDPMTLVQSPAEYNCLGAVRAATGSRNATLLALQRNPSGAEAQILSGADGSIWTCRANANGAVTGLSQGIAARPAASV